jgi:hypothetical protein
MLVLNILGGTDINGDKMKRLTKLHFGKKKSKLVMTAQSLGKIFWLYKRYIEMRLGSKLQEMGWDLGNGENKIVIFKLEMPTSR